MTLIITLKTHKMKNPQSQVGDFSTEKPKLRCRRTSGRTTSR